GASDFPHVEALRPERVRVDEVAGLIVRHHADVEPPLRVVPGQPPKRRGLSRTEKPTHHNEPDAMLHGTRVPESSCWCVKLGWLWLPAGLEYAKSNANYDKSPARLRTAGNTHFTARALSIEAVV